MITDAGRWIILWRFLAAMPVLAQAGADNSNLWPVHRDTVAAFRVSYPPGWSVVPPKGTNVRFSVSPVDGPGNCNVVVRATPALARMTQAELNREAEALPTSHDAWAGYVGVAPSQVVVVESRNGRVQDTPALIAVVETSLENLQGKYLRKATVAMMLKPGAIVTLNCGATSFSATEARARFVVAPVSWSGAAWGFKQRLWWQ